MGSRVKTLLTAFSAPFYRKCDDPHQYQRYYQADSNAAGVDHHVSELTGASLYEALVEFVGTALGDNECRHDKDPQPLPLGPLGARPPHGKAARKRRIFAEMRQLVPDLRKVFQLLVSKRRQFEDDCHA